MFLMDTVCIVVAFPSTIQTNHFYAKEQRRKEKQLAVFEANGCDNNHWCEYVTPMLA
jgi:hypothetical protein